MFASSLLGSPSISWFELPTSLTTSILRLWEAQNNIEQKKYYIMMT